MQPMEPTDMGVSFSILMRFDIFIEFANNLEISIHDYSRDLQYPTIESTMLNIHVNIHHLLFSNVIVSDGMVPLSCGQLRRVHSGTALP